MYYTFFPKQFADLDIFTQLFIILMVAITYCFKNLNQKRGLKNETEFVFYISFSIFVSLIFIHDIFNNFTGTFLLELLKISCIEDVSGNISGKTRESDDEHENVWRVGYKSS